MEPNQFLTEFMKLKVIAADYQPYFTEEDEIDILSWPTLDAKKVADWIIEAEPDLCLTQISGLFRSHTCPFCIYYTDEIMGRESPLELDYDSRDQDCDSCTYGDRHGICDDEPDDPKFEYQPYKKPTWACVNDWNNTQPSAVKAEALTIFKSEYRKLLVRYNEG